MNKMSQSTYFIHFQQQRENTETLGERKTKLKC